MNNTLSNPSGVTLVILNYRNASDTIACLDAVYAMPDTPGRVIVVDNGSLDDSPKRIADAWERLAGPIAYMETKRDGRTDAAAILVCLSENAGYAAGNNAGIRLALQDTTCRAIWILNNDTEPAAGSLKALCRRLNETSGAGLAGSTLVYSHARDTVQCAGGFILSRLTGATPAVRGGESLEKVGKLPAESVEKGLGYLCGASILARREVFDAAGFLPEEYFLYYEDAAFCLNAQRAGYTLAWAPSSLVFHKEGGSTGAESADAGRRLKRSRLMDYLALRNRIYLVRKYFPYCLPSAVMSYAGVMLNRLRRGQSERLPLVLKALKDGLRGKMGRPEGIAPSVKAHRVLFLTVRADFGGGPEHLWRLLQAMPEGMTACVACPNEYPYHGRFREIVGEGNIIELPHRTFSITKLWELRSFCAKQGISLLHSHGKGAGLYSRLLALLTGLPCVHTFHGVHMDGYSPGKRVLYRLYERIMSLFTKTGIAVSDGELSLIVEKGLMPRVKLRLVSNGVVIPDAGNLGTEFVASPPYTVVTLSRFDYQKNSSFLLDILHALKDMGRLNDFRLTAVGDGSDRQGMLDAVRSTMLENILRCPGASENPHAFFDGALCYLSTSRWEGMPLSVLEAMAHGLPVIASDVVGNRDVVRDGETGFLYPAGSFREAAALLCRLAEDPRLRRTTGEAARLYAKKNHDVRMMAEKTFRVLSDAATLR